MSNNKESSIDWLINRLVEINALSYPELVQDEIKEAKQIHRKEIETAFDKGYELSDNGYSDEYYDETFKTE